MNVSISKLEIKLLKLCRKLFYSRNEPFDFIAWLFCTLTIIFRKRTVREMKIGAYIDSHMPDEIKRNRRKRRRLYYDILYSALVFGSSINEYFWYHFDAKRYSERRKFITTYSRYLDFDIHVNNMADAAVFQNKYKTYLKFKEYFRRDAVLITSDDDYDDFCSFVKAHPKFVYKPTNKAFGDGIRLIDISQYESFKALFEEIIKDGVCVLEELIIQAPEMAELNASSVNTVRVPTIVTKDGVKVLYPFLKVGKDNSFVDNGGAGGILALIDLGTGIVCNTPTDEEGNRYILHPDTGKQLVGFQIPRWNELLILAEKLASVMPSVRYVGWDLALTAEGWVLVEGNNDGMFVGQQMLDQIGKKEAYYSLINQI